QAIAAHSLSSPHPNPNFFVNRIFFLKHVSLLQSLSLDDLQLVDQALRQREFLAGEIIFEEGSTQDDFFIIYRGNVLIRKHIRSTYRDLARLGSGEYFGDMALFEQAPRSATAIAETDCTLLSLERSHFQSLISHRPEIVMQMCRILSTRLREANERVD
ncbi:MAG: cyclic nucleotide-binding domain-containing protein, partial [Leptolyngbyaceae cyanobacterium bins.59]|nr:cyclic nucleotide-binding domain-containing protein [Leptolyngbyaceae cyanobacterium bins.59]